MSTRVSVTISGEPKAAPGIVGAFGGTTPASEILIEAETEDLTTADEAISFAVISSGAFVAAALNTLGTTAPNQED